MAHDIFSVRVENAACDLMITMGVSQALTTSDWAVFCPYGDMFCSYTEIYLHE